MSAWFDAKHISSFAKTALSEAQKTLDKALDIKEENEGKKGDDDGGEGGEPTNAADAPSKLWGSFTGSFFDPNEKGAAEEGAREKDDRGEVEEGPSEAPATIAEGPAAAPTDPILSQPVVSSSADKDPMTQSALLEEVDGDDLTVVQGDPEQDEVASSREGGAADGFSTSQLVIAPDAEEDEQCEVEDSMGSSAGTAVMMQSSGGAEHDPDAVVSTEVADAMAEEAMSERRSETPSSETPSSSKSFEVVQKSASEVTSGDELELETRTTSSDIEVIASPTPQSQQQQAAAGPLPASKGGGGKRRPSHARTGSEISHSGSSNEEADRLTRKLQEMSELLDAREVKVLELSNANFELVEKNTDLGSQVRERLTPLMKTKVF